MQFVGYIVQYISWAKGVVCSRDRCVCWVNGKGGATYREPCSSEAKKAHNSMQLYIEGGLARAAIFLGNSR